jgi:hypothetical protein
METQTKPIAPGAICALYQALWAVEGQDVFQATPEEISTVFQSLSATDAAPSALGSTPSSLFLSNYIGSFKENEPSPKALETISTMSQGFANRFKNLHSLLAIHEKFLDCTMKSGIHHSQTGSRITAAMLPHELQILEEITQSQINKFDDWGQTMLQYACEISSPLLVDGLLGSGANPQLTRSRWSPVHLAEMTENGSPETKAACVMLLHKFVSQNPTC